MLCSIYSKGQLIRKEGANCVTVYLFLVLGQFLFDSFLYEYWEQVLQAEPFDELKAVFGRIF